jgi:hypothetical protein
MEKIDNIQQYSIYADAIEVAPGCWDFLHKKDRKYYRFPENDFHIPVFLTRTNEIFEYVQIDKEEKVEKIIRQEINPFFIELSFFNGIKQNKVRHGIDLTNNMIDYIRGVRVEVADASNSEVVLWFDQIGINEFPWNEGSPSETTLDDIDKIDLVTNHIVSKANYFNIDINK